MRDSFIARLCELAAVHPELYLLTGDLGFKVFDRFRAEFPERFVNAGVAEQNLTALATGLALSGKTCFTYSIGNFSTLRCLEQIRNDVCYHRANVKVVSVGGGFSYGALGVSHHATEDLAILRSLPELAVLAPCGRWEAAEATEALFRLPGPAYLRLDKSYGDDRPQPGESFKLGKARRLRAGKDVTFVVCGGILGEVQAAAETLAGNGVQAGILGLHTVKPLDREALAEAAAAGPLVTVEEHTLDGGLGGAVAEALADCGVFPRRLLRIGLESTFSSIVGGQEYLRARYGMDAAAIAARTLKLLQS